MLAEVTGPSRIQNPIDEILDESDHSAPPTWLPNEMLGYFKEHDSLPNQYYTPILEAAQERAKDASRGYRTAGGNDVNIKQQIEVPYDTESPPTQALKLLKGMARGEEVQDGSRHQRFRWQIVSGVGASARKVPISEVLSLKDVSKGGGIGADRFEEGRVNLKNDPVIAHLMEQGERSSRGIVSGRFGQGVQRITVYTKAPVTSPAPGQITREEFHAESLKILAKKLSLSPKQEIEGIWWLDEPVTSVSGHENIYKRTFTVRIVRKEESDPNSKQSISELMFNGRYAEIKSSPENELKQVRQNLMLELAYQGRECPLTGRGVSLIVTEELTPWRGTIPKPRYTARTEEEHDEHHDRKKANWSHDFENRMKLWEHEVVIPQAPPLGRIRITMIGYQNRGPKRTWGQVEIPSGISDEELEKLGYTKDKKSGRWVPQVAKDGTWRYTDNFYKDGYPEAVVRQNTMAYHGASAVDGRIFALAEFIVSDQDEVMPQWEQYLNLAIHVTDRFRLYPSEVIQQTTFRVAKATDFKGAGNGKWTRYMVDFRGVNVNSAGEPCPSTKKIPDIGNDGYQKKNKDGSLKWLTPNKDGFWSRYNNTAQNGMFRDLEDSTYSSWEVARRGETASNGIGYAMVWSGTLDLPGNPSPRHANWNFVAEQANWATKYSGKFVDLGFKRREIDDAEYIFTYEDPYPVSDDAFGKKRGRHNFYGFVYRAMYRFTEVENTSSARTFIHPFKAYLFDKPLAAVKDRSVVSEDGRLLVA